jgi:hypothetical protein
MGRIYQSDRPVYSVYSCDNGVVPKYTWPNAPYAALLVQCCSLPTCGDTALQVAPNGNAAA